MYKCTKYYRDGSMNITSLVLVSRALYNSPVMPDELSYLEIQKAKDSVVE